MKKFSYLLTSLVCVFAGAIFYFVDLPLVSAQKADDGSPANLVSKTSSVEVVDDRDPREPSKFISAAASNSASLNSLSWPFGGKVQRGWEIYIPLISQTIGTGAAYDSTEFAASLAGWQGRNGVTANGVMNADSIRAFVKYWQAERRLAASRALPSELMSAPATDFWDPKRPVELLKLDTSAYEAYQRMLAAAPEEVKRGEFLKIVSAYRSPAYQAALRKREPNAGRAALAKNSPHFTGRALDIFVGGEPVTTRDDNRLLQSKTPAYKWLVKNAAKFGFYPYFYEPWHWEFVPER